MFLQSSFRVSSQLRWIGLQLNAGLQEQKSVEMFLMAIGAISIPVYVHSPPSHSDS